MAKAKKALDKPQHITDQIIALLEEGTKPWEKTWVGGSSAIANITTGRSYSGRNPLVLTTDCITKGYEFPLFCGRKQGFEKGWKLRKGCKASYVQYASMVPGKGEEADPYYLVKWSAVFRVPRYFLNESVGSVGKPLL